MSDLQQHGHETLQWHCWRVSSVSREARPGLQPLNVLPALACIPTTPGASASRRPPPTAAFPWARAPPLSPCLYPDGLPLPRKADTEKPQLGACPAVSLPSLPASTGVPASVPAALSPLTPPPQWLHTSLHLRLLPPRDALDLSHEALYLQDLGLDLQPSLLLLPHVYPLKEPTQKGSVFLPPSPPCGPPPKPGPLTIYFYGVLLATLAPPWQPWLICPTSAPATGPTSCFCLWAQKAGREITTACRVSSSQNTGGPGRPPAPAQRSGFWLLRVPHGFPTAAVLNLFHLLQPLAPSLSPMTSPPT